MKAWMCVFITKPLTPLNTHISFLSLTTGVTVCTVVWLPVFGDISDGSERRGVNTRRRVLFCFVFWLQGLSCWWLAYWVGGALHSLPISPPPPPDIQKTAVATGSACAQTWYTHTPLIFHLCEDVCRTHSFPISNLIYDIDGLFLRSCLCKRDCWEYFWWNKEGKIEHICFHHTSSSLKYQFRF